jgi:hypothetical protein
MRKSVNLESAKIGARFDPVISVAIGRIFSAENQAVVNVCVEKQIQWDSA